jgi:hypothetical protein
VEANVAHLDTPLRRIVGRVREHTTLEQLDGDPILLVTIFSHRAPVWFGDRVTHNEDPIPEVGLIHVSFANQYLSFAVEVVPEWVAILCPDCAS